jgi:hypothetical protein
METHGITTNHFYIVCVLIGILIVFVLLQSRPINKIVHATSVKNENNIIKQSKIPNAGKGVFSGKNYNVGEIVEECDYLLEDPNNLIGTSFVDYFWDEMINGQRKAIVPFTGKCNMANHSDDANTEVSYDNNNKKLFLKARKRINKGDEITNNYGFNYWNDRTNYKKNK